MTETNNQVTAVEQTPSAPPVAPAPEWGDLGFHSWVKVGILGVLISWLFWPDIYRLVHQWCTDSSWSHGFLIPLFSLYFLNQRKAQILSVETKPNYLGLVLLITFLALCPINIVQFQIGYLKSLLFVLVLAAVVLYQGGWGLFRYTWLPVLYLIFAIPLPDRIYKTITIPMRIFAADISTAVLNMVPNLEATASGVVIDIVYKGLRLEPALDVAEACSGMRLLMAFLALGVAMAYLHYRPTWQRIILLLSTVPIAIFCNVVRVTITALIYVLINPKYAQGIYHDMLGMLMLPLAFGLYGLLAWFMSSLFVDEEAEVKPDVVVRKRSA